MNLTLRLLALLLLLLPGALRAQTLDPTFQIPEIYGEAAVNDAAQMASGQYVVAGSFTRANGQASKGLARFDAAGVEDQAFRQNLSAATIAVAKLLPMPNGQLLVQGSYQAGAIQRNYLFRLNADGTLDPTLSVTLSPNPTMPMPRVLETLLQADGRILIRGEFTTNVHAEIMRLLSDGTPDPSFSFSMPYGSLVAQMLLQPDGKLVISGDFTWLNGVPSFFVARLNTDGSTDTSFQNAAYTNAALHIKTVALDANGSLVVGGLGVNVINGQQTSLFRLLPTGALDASFVVAPSIAARDCDRVAVQPNGQIVVLTDTYASVNSARLPFDSQVVRLQATGALDTSFQPGSGPDYFLGEVRSLANGSVLTWGIVGLGGGTINNFAGQRRTLALLQPSGGVDASFAPLLQKPARVQKIVRQADGKLLVVGTFNAIGGHLTDRIARLLPNGQPDLSFAWRQPNSASWNFSALLLQASGQVLLAGVASPTNSNLQIDLVRLSANGVVDPTFAAPALNPSGRVEGIRLLAETTTGQIVVGGTFVDAAGKANLTRLMADGSLDPAFAPAAPRQPITGGFVEASGNLMCVVPVPGSSGRHTIERLLPTGVPDPAFAYTAPGPTPPGPPTTGLEHVFPALAAGEYITSGVLSTTDVMGRITATGAAGAGVTTPFRPILGINSFSSGVNCVAVQSDGRLLVGGYMQQNPQYGSPVTPLARLDASGQLDPTFSTSTIVGGAGIFIPLTAVEDMLIQPDGAIVVGGYFLQAGNQPVTGLIRLSPSGVLGVAAEKGLNASVQAWPVPAQAVLQLKLDASTRPQRVTLLDALGKAVLTQSVTQPEFALNVAPLARGLYVLRVDYASGPATRRVSLE